MAFTEGRGRYLYTASKDGQTYRVLIPKWLGTDLGTEFGFGADDSTRPALPRYIKMRYVTAILTGGSRHRKIHCGTQTCTGWTTLSTSVTLPDINGASSVYVTVGQVGEKYRGTTG
jgi:hypothetical protein